MASDLSVLSLFPATPQQIIQARRRTLPEWGKGLTLEEHLQRDASQDEFEGSRDGRLITWVLAPREDPQTLDFKCACETFKRTGLIADSGKDAPETVTSYAIASVFTPPKNRGKGFARHMMRLLHWVIADESLLHPGEFPAAWGEPPAKVDGAGHGRFSALWSDVGHFYNACGPVPGVKEGWVVRGTMTTVWDVDSSPVPESALQWTWLDDSGVSELWDEDVETIRSNLKQAGVSFSFLPNTGVASFQHRRLKVFLERLVVPPIETWGVISPDNKAFATWTVDPRPPAPRTLIVSRIQANSQVFEELVGKILEIAKKYNVKRVEVWNLPKELEILATTLGAETYERQEHLPAFKWYGKEPESSVTWAYNEK
ncbi:hypothetical protein B0H10DRAFT_471845 [Mycena sp. CBHHK59/15]|nr:hypothetical protein B0H10DRAFT_471845 [Mycena sp. CBHHK59/15]